MNIFYLHQHFAPPESSGNNRSLELAANWASKGHKVTILCGSGNFDKSLSWFVIFKKYKYKGFTVLRLNVPYSHYYPFLQRIISFIKYLIFSLLLAFKMRKADIIYASSTPLTIGITALWLKYFFNKPYVFETVDLWPDTPIQMGVIKNNFLKKALWSLEKIIYKKASHIICLSEGMKELIVSKKINDEKVTIAHNGTDCSYFTPCINKDFVKGKLNLTKGKFTILYAGTIGEANGLHFLAEVANEIQKNSQHSVQFLIVGNGNRKEELKTYCQNKSLQNILFLDTVPKAMVKQFFDAADTGFVCFAPYPILETNSANKFYDYLAAGLPVLINYGGWQKNYLDEFHAGFSQRTPKEMAKQIILLSQNKNLLAEMGKNARSLAETRFDRKDIAEKILDIFTSIKSN